MSNQRNQPCPCGSGKKYKKCCINRPSPVQTEPLLAQSETDDLEDLYDASTFWLEDDLSERTENEAAYDSVLIEALKDGKTIVESIAIANGQYPKEALKYSIDQLGEVENHYRYLSDHFELKKRFLESKANSNLNDQNKRLLSKVT